jgi:hypothetical protein
MSPTPSVGEIFSQSFWFLQELLFKWVPGTIVGVTGLQTVSEPSVSGPSIGTILYPVTVPQAVQYLQTAAAPGVWENLYYHWTVYVTVSLFVSLLFIALIIYCVIRIEQIRYHERVAFSNYARSVETRNIPRTQARWQRILEETGSDNEQQWRLAILEADIMLNELLDTLGYKGETMSDKLKQVERADFHTVDAAWDAHRFRNRIAHEGTAMRLDKHDVDDTIGKYQRVFREFDFLA